MRLLAFVEKGFEAGVACTGYGQARAVGENGQAAVFAIRLDAHDAFEIHDVGAVDAHEGVWIEAGFEAGDGLLLEMLFCLGWLKPRSRPGPRRSRAFQPG